MGAHTFHLLIVERTNNSKTTTMKSFAVVLAAAVAAAQGQAILPANFAHAGLPLGYNGLAPGFAGLPLAAPAAYAGLPLAAPAAFAQAPIAAPATIIPAAPKTYAVPPARLVQEPAVVETITTPVEQHGYKIKY